MVVFGLPVPSDVDAQVSVDYAGGETPTRATVTVTLDGFLDDSVRGSRTVLQFEKEACPTCEPDGARWHLRTQEEAWRCYEGRGHQDFSKELCN